MEESKTCFKCLQPKPLVKFSKLKSGYRLNVCSLCRGRQERAHLKLLLIAKFGGKCNCCGEDHPAFLTLDHVEGLSPDQKKLRRARKEHTLKSWRQALKSHLENEYQLLCMNCNFAKGHYGVCPHQSCVTTEQALGKLKEDSRLPGHDQRDYTGSSKTWFKPGHEGFRLVAEP